MTEAADFVGRERELKVLEDAWASSAGAFVPVYGRRRIGKSTLLLQFLEKKRGLYHVGKVAPAELQIRELLQTAAEVLKQPLLAQVAVTTWKAALEHLERAWPEGERLVLVLDEFQWTVGASPELPSVLQELWDRKWRHSGRMMLVLCGSFVGFMEHEVLGKKSPLYGRRTAQIHLQPMSWHESSLLHSGWSLEQQTEAYFICGGVPQYLLAFDPKKSVRTNIETTLLDEFAPLYREPEFLLREELREVEKYHAVLYAVAAGETTQRRIAQVTGLPERSLHYWLEQLVQLGYVGRRFPLTGGPRNRRKVRFVLEDPLLKFWFRFVFPHKSALAYLGPALTFAQHIKPELDAYFGGCFERLAKEMLPHVLRHEGVTASVEVGEYWDSDVQIDLVGIRDDGCIDLGECKWGKVRSAPAVRAELATKLAAFPNPKQATLRRRFFVRNLPAKLETERDETWHDLASLQRLVKAPSPRAGKH
jgi:AAA+ ATPase superfamily predicted ATPase